MSIEVFKKIKDEARFIKGQPIPIQIKLFSSFVTLLDTMLKAPDRRNRKLMEKLRNSAQSFVEGLRSGEAEQSDILEFVDEAVEAYDEASRQQREEEEKRKNGPQALPPSNDESPGQQEDITPAQRPIIRNNTGQVIDKYDKFRSRIPKRITSSKGWTTVRCPIVIMTQPALNMEALRRYRLAQDSISWYTVLSEQVLVGLDNDWMVSLIPEKKSSRKANNPGLGHNPNLKMEPIVKNAMDEILKAIKERWGQQCMIMGRPKKLDNVLWVWIASNKIASQLNHCSPTQHFIVTDWGFPFKSEVRHWEKRTLVEPRENNLTNLSALKKVEARQKAEIRMRAMRVMTKESQK